MTEHEKLYEISKLKPDTIEVECENGYAGGIVLPITGRDECPFCFYGKDDGSDDRWFSVNEFNQKFKIKSVVFEGISLLERCRKLIKTFTIKNISFKY